jgi:hypothetical protein
MLQALDMINMAKMRQSGYNVTNTDEGKDITRSKIDSNIVTKEKLMAEQARTQNSFLDTAKRRLQAMLTGANKKPTLMNEDDNTSKLGRRLTGLLGSKKVEIKPDEFTTSVPKRKSQMTCFLENNPIFIMPQNQLHIKLPGMSDDLIDFDILDMSLRQPKNAKKEIQERRENPKREHIYGAYQPPKKGFG